MRLTVELPDGLLDRARRHAADSGLSLDEFFLSALEQRLAVPAKHRRPPPTVEGPPGMRPLTSEEIDVAMFGYHPNPADAAE